MSDNSELGEWIEWKGGECPLPNGTPHEVRFRDGFTLKDNSPETWVWAHDKGGSDGEIIAYRLIDPASLAREGQ